MVAVEFQAVTKRFRRRGVAVNYHTLKGLLAGAPRPNTPQPIEALRSISFQTTEGDTLALIGPNGAGKSTLLKLAAGIYQPDEGSVHTRGRIGSLIELGLGVHPDFTGRENVVVSGLLHDLTRRELTDRFSDIVAFAELGDYIDEPVRTYSTGMCMRLGFSVAIHTDPQILLIDEVFSVGDGIFIDKCIEWMDGFQKSGGTIVVASHDLDLVRRRCHQALWLDSGQVRALGDASEVADAYATWIANSHAPAQ
jgi:lipopolysaccharide transport system ATP-binding protein